MRIVEDYGHEERRRQILVFIGLAFLLLVARTAQLQIVQGGRYDELSERNRIRMILSPAPRGKILDRNGHLLVDSHPGYVIAVVPDVVEADTATIASLAAILDVPAGEIRERISGGKLHPLEPVKIARGVGIEVVSVIEERRSDLSGVVVEAEPVRRYRYGAFASHILGYLGEISEKELLRLRDRGYHYGDLIGRMGVEEAFEEYLRGEEGVEFVEVDARGRELGALPGKETVYATPGLTVCLTIDYRLQAVLEEALEPYDAGAAIALDPRNGDVLAMVSHPDFDPNRLSSRMRPEEWLVLRRDPRSPLWNRTIWSAYPPGSSLKVATAAAGLEEGLIGATTRLLPCHGGFQYGNRWFRCWRPEGHGSPTTVEAIIQSCDVFFYQVGMKLGVERFSRHLRRYGFGSPTGIDLPGEAEGLVADVAWYDRRYGEGRWSPGVVLNLAIGQGETLVTPIQLASFFSALAADGEVHIPHVLDRIVDRRGNLVKEAARGQLELGLSPSTLAILQGAMWGVVNDEHGTGRLAGVRGLGVCGKTGTAQNPHGEDHSWFVGYAPAEDPEVVIAVIVENAGHGGSVAAPIVGRAIEHYLGAAGRGEVDGSGEPHGGDARTF
jgi:penicillin-binding protein 2